MGKPVLIESATQWDASLTAAKEKNQAIVVDFFATWCGPCKTIAPTYERLASKYSNAVFLKVDVDQHQGIAAKYKVTAMPTFLVIKESGVVDMVRGADAASLAAMVLKHASAAAPLDPEAEKVKADGNTAFAAGQYAVAVDHYSRAIALAPRSAVLRGNRAFAYIKLIESAETPKTERLTLRPKALQDAHDATSFDEKWAKGWIRMAQALMLAGDEEAMESVAEGKRAAGRVTTLEGAKEALENAIGLSDGTLRADAQKMLEGVQKQLQI